ncbi:MAG: toll/interleukin-1 receptor domain-containing protein [Pseudomonadota bacterium]
MADVFLSYARADAERALVIKEALEALGLSVFFDTDGLDSGDVFPDVLDREVKTAGAVVGIWSTHALTRPWVKIECDIGRARGVLVPIQIEPIADLDKPAAFWNVQFDDLMGFDGNTDHAGWVRFIRSLARTLDRKELLEAESRRHPVHPNKNDALEEEVLALRAELTALRREDETAIVPQAQPNQTLVEKYQSNFRAEPSVPYTTFWTPFIIMGIVPFIAYMIYVVWFA